MKVYIFPLKIKILNFCSVFKANDLQGVRAYSNLDMKGLYTLGTVIVDYRGYRVTAQSIIPGGLYRAEITLSVLF